MKDYYKKREELLKRTYLKKEIDSSTKNNGSVNNKFKYCVLILIILVSGFFLIEEKTEKKPDIAEYTKPNILKNPVKDLPDNSTIDLRKKAHLLYTRKEYLRASSALNIVISKNPKDIDSIILNSNALTELGRYKTAIENLDIGIKNSPENYFLYRLKAEAFMKLKDYRSAAQNFEISLLKNPDVYENYVNKGISYYKINNMPKALQSFEEAIELKNSSEVWFHKARVLNELSRDEEAEKAYGTAIKLSVKKNAVMELDYCKQLLVSKKYFKADEVLSSVIDKEIVEKVKKSFLKIAVLKATRKKVPLNLEKRFIDYNELYYVLDWSCKDIIEWMKPLRLSYKDNLYMKTLVSRLKRTKGFEKMYLTYSSVKKSKKIYKTIYLNRNLTIYQGRKRIRKVRGVYLIKNLPFKVKIRNIRYHIPVQIFAYHTDKAFKKYSLPIESERTDMFMMGSGLAMSVNKKKEINLDINSLWSHYHITYGRRINSQNEAIINIAGISDPYKKISKTGIVFLTFFVNYNRDGIIESNEIANIKIRVKKAATNRKKRLKSYVSTLGYNVDVKKSYLFNKNFSVVRITNSKEAVKFRKLLDRSTQTTGFIGFGGPRGIGNNDYSKYNEYYVLSPVTNSIFLKQPYNYNGTDELIFDVGKVARKNRFVSVRYYLTTKKNDILKIVVNYNKRRIIPEKIALN